MLSPLPLPLPPRHANTLHQILASKAAPAGAGWWGANVIASEHMGLAGTDVAHFVTTALGDASAVWIGHCLFFFAKSMARPGAGIEMKKEVQSASLLGGATLSAGFVWQPACNVLATAPFFAAAAGTGAACDFAFFLGLRGFRAAFGRCAPTAFSAVAPPTAENRRDDAGLSLAVAGATGTFVGVVVDFADNPFIGTSVAILATASAASGCLSSAKATCLGFAAVQTVQNLGAAPGENWIDGCVVDGTYKTE